MTDASLMLVGLGLAPGAYVSRSEAAPRQPLLLVNLEPFEHAATSQQAGKGVTVWRAEDGRVVTVGVDLPREMTT